jgi:fumarate reductase flavoprotein subunit
MGLKFRFVASHNPGFHKTFHVVDGPTPSHNDAAEMMRVLEKRAKELGIQIFLKTPAEKLIKEDGRITGVIARDKSGEEVMVKARAVILATGGFYVGSLPGFPGKLGDGMRLAQEVGAAVSKITRTGAKSGIGPPRRGFRPVWTVGFTFQQPGLIVNLLGERFINEEIIVNTNFGRNAIARQKNATAFNIFDEATKQHYVEKGLDFAPGGLMVSVTRAENFDAEFQEILDAGSGNFFKVSSLKELCAQTGIDLNGLTNTIAEYNRACEIGRDYVMNKNPRILRPVKQPPFYASKTIASDTHDWGGIKINHKTEVLTGDYVIIPGLYAAGMDAACELYHGTYPFVLPATAMGFAINSGRLAAENALDYIKSARKRK